MVVAVGLILLVLAPGGARPAGEEDLPDFSYAGYHRGERGIPKRAPTVDVTDFGAVDDGKTDCTEALRTALVAAAKAKGVVRIPAGRWVLTEPVEIRTDGVVLQGAGSEKTTLVCPNSLAEIRGPNPNWSWSGGMVRIGPPGGRSVRFARITRTASAGATSLPVEFRPEVDRPKAGEWIEILWYNDTRKDTLLDHLFGGVIPRARMGKELQEARGARVKEWARIEAIEEGAIRIAQPLRIDARPEWGCDLVRRPHVEEVGVEGLTFEFPKTAYPGHLKEKGYNAIEIQSAIDCWVRDIRTIHADSGVFVNSSKHVTVEGVVLQGKGMHHPLSISWSSDCLVTRWRIEAPHVHGTTLSWAAHGNVFSEGYGRSLAMDCHRAAPFDNLHTAIVIEHEKGKPRPFRSGGSGPRGPHSGRRNVYWNIEIRFPEGVEGPVAIGGHDEWPLGVFVGWRGSRPLQFRPVERLRQRVLDLNREPKPANLHEQQLEARLRKGE